MKKNKGVTLIELIIVLTCLTGVLAVGWSILNSSSEDAYTINDKIEVQNTVTALMNVLQQDVQEASIITDDEDTTQKYICTISPTPSSSIVVTNECSFGENLIYEFDDITNTVTRTETTTGNISEYNNITKFLLNYQNSSSKYGVTIHIVGQKEDKERSRYELNSTFYSRNTM